MEQVLEYKDQVDGTKPYTRTYPFEDSKVGETDVPEIDFDKLETILKGMTTPSQETVKMSNLEIRLSLGALYSLSISKSSVKWIDKSIGEKMCDFASNNLYDITSIGACLFGLGYLIASLYSGLDIFLLIASISGFAIGITIQFEKGRPTIDELFERHKRK